VLDGLEDLINKGHSTVTITKIALVHADELALTSARLAPVGHHGHFSTLAGVLPGGPGPDEPGGRLAVEKSRPAIGATIKPGAEANLLLFIKASHGGKMGPPKVTYTDETGTYAWTGGTNLIIPATTKCVEPKAS
jgi:hypothetical protein